MKPNITNLKIKLKEVYLPFLLISIGTITVYSIFRWIFDIKLHIIPLKKDVLDFWLPFVIPWIPVLLWLRRRVHILKVGGRDDSGHSLYQAIMAVAITIPLIISQQYIEKASFDLIPLNTINEIQHHSDEKYFSAPSFRVNENACVSYVTARTSGKRNQHLTFFLYIGCPFENASTAWYGILYTKKISNRLSDEKKDAEYRTFLEESSRKFDAHPFETVKYFKKLGHSDKRDGFIEAIKESYPHINESEQVILMPQYDNFSDRLGNTVPWIFGSFAIGAFILLLMIAIPKIDTKAFNDFKQGKPLKDDILKVGMHFLDPRGQYQAVALLILINSAVFVVMTFMGLSIISPTAKQLLEIGANRRFEVMNGEYWRLVSSIFIHGGIVHLFMNMVGLGLAGIMLEGLMSTSALLLSFLVCGISGSVVSIWWYENTVSVGASGAIFGLYGIILAFTVLKKYARETQKMNWLILALYPGIGLLYGILGGIDNAAHLGGLITGCILGCIMVLIKKR